jgi:cytosine/adenosine deaminase-related metal-dependent hydrolase
MFKSFVGRSVGLSALGSAFVMLAVSCGASSDGDAAPGDSDGDGGSESLDATAQREGGAQLDAAVDDDALADGDVSDGRADGADAMTNDDASDAAAADADANDGAAADGGSSDGSTTDSGDAGAADADAGDAGFPGPVLEKVGSAGTVLLKGTVLTPDTAFAGEVLVVGDLITCVAASCAASAGASTASVVQTHGVILPGLINDDDHVLFEIMDATDWAPTQTYANPSDWTVDARYKAMVDAKQYLNGEGSAVDLGCEMDKYGELKALLAGTTSIVGTTSPANRACYGTLARTVDQTPNGLGADKIQTAIIFPTAPSADDVCANFADASTDAYLVHVGEGTNAAALNDFAKLGTITTTDGCLYSPKTALVHGTALTATEFTTMGAQGMGLVWSPRSDVALYGKTTDVALAISKGVNVSVSTNWSVTGSPNMLEELRFADEVDNAASAVLTPKMLVQMATTHAAKNLGLSGTIGSLAVGMKADITVISGNTALPYDAVIAARPRDVQLVMVGGAALVGSPALQAIAQASPPCESLDVCGSTKFACVAASGGTLSNKFAQTLAEIQSSLSTALTSYDTSNLTAFDFAPIAPLAHCD